jgi:FkbH-like protein
VSANATALDELLQLHRTGRLADVYGPARPLLDALTDDELTRAGHLLSRLDPDAVRAAQPGVRDMRAAVTGHGVPVSLVAALTAQCARHGLLLEAYVGGYDSYLLELSDPSSNLYAARPDLVLCLLDPAMIADELPVPWGVADVERVFAEKLRLVEGLAAGFVARGGGTVVLNTIPLPHDIAGQLRDARSRTRLGMVWREANIALLRLATRYPSALVVDLDPLVARGVPVVDERLRAYARAHLSPALLAAYAREVGHLAAYLTGGGRKCLVVDLDNTLWGGVLGDDGIDGIEVCEGHRGEAFRTVQRVVKQLGAQGVLLAAVSKNDPEPVARVLREHPGMTLRPEDFVRVVANWQPKHENLLELAQALNLGVDSFVFADDSPNERGQVRHLLPGVAVVDLDDEPAGHVGRLLRDGWFATPDVTAEDRARTALYRDELARADFLDSFSTIEDYLRELLVRVELGPARDRDVPRLSQLTMRTNQFNLTTRRLAPAEVTDHIAEAASLVLCIRATDRFGDNGLVGAIFARRDADALHLDNMLLSCRVFGRGIEQACLSAVLRWARDTDLRAVYGRYLPTAKNGTVRDLYPRYGFVADRPDGAGTVFRHDLAEVVAVPDHVELRAELSPALGARPEQ